MFRGLIAVWSIIALFNLVDCEICKKAGSSDYDSSMKPCFDLGTYKFNQDKRVQERNEVELECYVKNKAANSVIWLFNDQFISLNGQVVRPDPNIKLDTDLISKFNLRLSNVSPQHSGQYKCQISTLIAQNLEYNLDVLVAPSIVRSPSTDVITLSQGETLKVQCLASGNPEPKLTWSKKGDKAEHTTIDENKSELILEDVDQTHADIYSCTANNDVGTPVTSEFEVKVKFTPTVSVVAQKSVKADVLYTKLGEKVHVKFLVNAYPEPEITLFHNDVQLVMDSRVFKEAQPSGKSLIVTYTLDASDETFGEYKCVAKNELGISDSILEVTQEAGDVTIKNENFPVYSDAVLFEWSVLSGSAIKQLQVKYFTDEAKNGTERVTDTNKVLADGTEIPAAYYKENIQFKNFYELTKLSPNTTYTIKLRVKNEMDGWSAWSNSLTVKTHKHHAERKHKPHSYHHKYHARKQHHLFDGNSNMEYNKYLTGTASQATRAPLMSIAIVNVIFILKTFWF